MIVKVSLFATRWYPLPPPSNLEFLSVEAARLGDMTDDMTKDMVVAMAIY